MVNPVDIAIKQIQTIIENAYKLSAEQGKLLSVDGLKVNVETPNDIANGDFSSNIAMQTTKIQKKAPKIIAEQLVSNMELADTYIKKVEVAGPGFINFYLSDSWFTDVNRLIYKYKNDYGRTDYGKGKKVMIEFVSANPTGPMHMGNARGGALGDCLASVMDFAGFDVTREFYVNDAGNQIEKFGYSLEARYMQKILGEENFEFPEDGYHGDDIKEHAENYAKLYGNKLADVTPEERRKALVEYALPINISAIKADIERYRINFDVWFRESELYKNGEVDETLEILKNNGLTYEKEGAIWFKSTEFGCEKDDVLVRNNGIPTYMAADIAYHRNKFKTRGFDTVIDIWGADHHGHIARLKGAMQAVGLNPDNLEVIIMQLVRLMSGNQVVRMSKRSGKSITLRDLLDETSVDAARYFFNARQASSHLDFDLDLAVTNSSENPVYYVQYAHARICSIIRLLKEEGITVDDIDGVDLTLLKAKEEIDIMRHLCYLPEEIKNCAKNREPSRLTRYLTELAAFFHSFYNACRVRCDDQNLMKARIVLCKSVLTVMKNVLTLIGIEAPEKM